MHKRVHKVKEHPHLVRRDGAIVNTDREGFLAFIANREVTEAKDARISLLESELAELKSAVTILMSQNNTRGRNAKKQD